MDDLLAFLRAQLAEDERVANLVLWFSRDTYGHSPAEEWVSERKVNNAEPPYFDDQVVRTDRQGMREHEILRLPRLGGELLASHIARFGSPHRVLAEVEAKRQVIQECAYALEKSAPRSTLNDFAWTVLRPLVQPYAGREGWREQWAL